MKIQIEYLNTYNKEWGVLKHAKKGDAGVDLRSVIYETIDLFVIKVK